MNKLQNVLEPLRRRAHDEGRLDRDLGSLVGIVEPKELAKRDQPTERFLVASDELTALESTPPARVVANARAELRQLLERYGSPVPLDACDDPKRPLIEELEELLGRHRLGSRGVEGIARSDLRERGFELRDVVDDLRREMQSKRFADVCVERAELVGHEVGNIVGRLEPGDRSLALLDRRDDLGDDTLRAILLVVRVGGGRSLGVDRAAP